MGYDEEKFREFNKMLKADDIDVCVIHHPQVLGDNYEELVENLNRLADSGKSLTIIQARNEVTDAKLRSLPLVLTPREIAKLLRCGKSTIYEMVRCGKIAYLRLGRRILVPRASLVKMLESAGDTASANPHRGGAPYLP